jgi:hypothetical protein
MSSPQDVTQYKQSPISRKEQRVESTNLTQMGMGNSISNFFDNEDKIKTFSEAEFSFEKEE